MIQKGIKILSVDAGSTAEQIGLVPGDVILEIDGHEITDELALRFYLADGTISLLIRRKSGGKRTLIFEATDETHLGIRIEEFQTRTCHNACIFCFVDQLPPGVRPSLRIKDDDYRLSFLHGNYITLTNLSSRDIARIVRERLSPLYVSVHATEPDLRMRLLGRKKGDTLLARIETLVRQGIILQTQIVLMPGINDGPHLEKTVLDLFDFYPGIRSIAIVPLGLSDYGRPKDILKPVTPGFCRKTVRQVTALQHRFRAETGETFAYIADEFYLQGGFEIPEAYLYDDFSQIEDGVGMVRTFLDTFETEWKRRSKNLGLRGTIVTGKLFYPILKNCMDRFNQKFGSHLQVCMARNKFLGKKITVSGLLSGTDVLKAIRGSDEGNFVIIPQDALSQNEGIFLDDLSLEDVSQAIGKPVYTSGRTVRDFFLLMKKLSEENNR